MTVGLAVAVAGCLGSAPTGGNGGSGGGGGGGTGGHGGGGGGGAGGGGGTGGGGGGGGGGGSAGAPLGNELCRATLTVSGQYVQGNPPPADLGGGCWPDGMWTFSATITDGGGCTNAPTLPSQYQVQVTQDDDFNDTITFVTDPNNMFTHMHMNAGDGGICTGIFQWVSDDGFTIFEMHPSMQADNSLIGGGQYSMYDADQRN
ncbi:MAG TPA: hypothetical protein VHB97_01720 [Polyangia bacterium]|nr:hypothetical protein [Polyangia bacterium]